MQDGTTLWKKLGCWMKGRDLDERRRIGGKRMGWFFFFFFLEEIGVFGALGKGGELIAIFRKN